MTKQEWQLILAGLKAIDPFNIFTLQLQQKVEAKLREAEAQEKK